MKVVHTFDDVRELSAGSTGFVATMGFLHEGHLSLIDEARRSHDTVVVSVFVNPLQFGETTDLESYPRDLERDVRLAEATGADLVFAPDVDYMYGGAPHTSVIVRDVSGGMEGDVRPGHFAGVATVVAKLFTGIQPQAAYFGRKDAQQLAVVSTMVRDLSFPVEVRAMPIIREVDGLALSSRNVRLGPSSRERAVTVSQGLMAGADLFEQGVGSVPDVLGAVRDQMEYHGGVDVEYVELAAVHDAKAASYFEESQFLAVAARVDGVRLIDNVTLDFETGTADRGIRLESPSILYGGV
jgi:pantoate--beta-alanine ligase